MAEQASFGLIAGAGMLPIEALRCLESRGERVLVIAFEGVTDPALRPEAPRRGLGQLGEVLAALSEASLERLLIVGRFDRGMLAADSAGAPDDLARELLARVATSSDVAVMETLALWLEERSLRLCRQDDCLSDLLARGGPISSGAPSPQALADLEAGRAALSAQSRDEIGQAIAIENGRVLAREGAGGTDAMIDEAGRRAEAPFTVVKGARPGQDPRLDLPAIGPATIDVMKRAGASAIAVEGGATLVIERARVREQADAAGIVVWGFDAESPPSGSGASVGDGADGASSC